MRTPFKFLDSYTRADRDAFFGRDKEIKELYQKVHESPLILVYGLSGTGKTSLVQCGLASEFDSTDWFPIFIRHQGDINESFQQALRREFPAGVQTSESPQENIALLYRYFLRPVYLIFDQLEELFLLGNQDEQVQFAESLRGIIDAELPCKILLIMREEFIGYLYNLEEILPGINDYRLRVEPMEDARVAEVVKKSCEKFNIQLEDEEQTPKKIIENVRGERDARTGLKSRIQLPYLQVYLDGLYQEVAAAQAWEILRPPLKEKWPELDGAVIRRWLKTRNSKQEPMGEAPSGTVTAEQRKFCLDRLEAAGMFVKAEDGSRQLNDAPYPELTFHNQQIDRFGTIQKVLGDFLNSQTSRLKTTLIEDYHKQGMSEKGLQAVVQQLQSGRIKTEDAAIPEHVSRDQFLYAVQLLEQANIIEKQEGHYQGRRKYHEKLEKKYPEFRKYLEEKFTRSSGPALQKLLNGFVTLEGTKRPLERSKINSQFLTVDQVNLSLDHLENARILRQPEENRYEVAHDALAKRIATQRTQEQVTVLEVAKLVKSKNDTYSIMVKNRPDKAGASEYLLSNGELQLVSQVEPELQEGEHLTSAEWKFVEKSHALRKRQRRRRQILLGSLGVILLGFLLAGVGKVAEDRAAAAFKAEISEANQERDLAINEKRVLSETYAAIESDRVSLMNNFRKLGDYYKGSDIPTALKFYNKAAGLALAAPPDSSLSSLDNLNYQIEGISLIFSDSLPRFDSLILQGDYFYSQGTPYHYDAFYNYQQARRLARRIDDAQREAEASENIQKVTAGMLTEDMAFLRFADSTMRAAQGQGPEIADQEIKSKIQRIESELVNRSNQ